LKSGGEF
jgi:hypothetical protein